MKLRRCPQSRNGWCGRRERVGVRDPVRKGPETCVPEDECGILSDMQKCKAKNGEEGREGEALPPKRTARWRWLWLLAAHCMELVLQTACPKRLIICQTERIYCLLSMMSHNSTRFLCRHESDEKPKIVIGDKRRYFATHSARSKHSRLWMAKPHSPAFITVPNDGNHSIAYIVQPLLLGRPSVCPRASATTSCNPQPPRTQQGAIGNAKSAPETRTA